jgi:restriction system protein
MMREAEKQRKAQRRAEEQAAKQDMQARKAYERAQLADQKERARLYAEFRAAQVDLQNNQLQATVEQLHNLLHDALAVDSFIDLETLKENAELPVFDPGDLAIRERPPSLQAYLPPALSGLQQLLPGAKKKHAEQQEAARHRYEAHLAAFTQREVVREQKLAQARAAHEQEVAAVQARMAAQHVEIDAFRQDLATGSPDAVAQYATMVLGASPYPDGFPARAKAAYIPESKQFVVEYQLPAFDIVPDIGSYRYVKTKDEVTSTARPASQRKDLYGSVVAQVTLRTLHELFEADRTGHLETIVFNGYVDTIDKGTGLPSHVYLTTVRVTRDTFTTFDLRRVEPALCLKRLNAAVSKSPTELAPVRPVLEFDMVDPRFIEETDVLSGLDQRPNLMDLTPSEFEALIANLFSKMGLETRQTQASRDGGVDCVAYDPRPILGGKVVIQAKRYKHTVGVSAVRDLFGTMQNEGASKGILVTTSGYGKAAFEFAEGKPIELLSGSNLLYLLFEHAGIEARIEAPDSWRDPEPDRDVA